MLKSVYASRILRDESSIGLGFGHVSVSDARSLCLEIGFVFSLNTINDDDFTINDTLPQPQPFFPPKADPPLAETKPLRRILKQQTRRMHNHYLTLTPDFC